MSLRQAILKISGFFSITSLESTEEMSKALSVGRDCSCGCRPTCAVQKRGYWEPIAPGL